MAKVNVNAELRRAYLQSVADRLPTALAGADAVSTWSAARSAVSDAAVRTINLLTTERGTTNA